MKNSCPNDFYAIFLRGDVYADIVNILLFDGKPKKSKQRFPGITLVLYFGFKHRWSKKRKLSEFVFVPHDLLPYFNDYKLNVFEIAWLEEKTVSKFQSDFKYVADFFVQMRKNKNYKPTIWQLNHLAAFLDLMSVLTGDYRFSESYNSNIERSVSDMTIPFLDEVENRGIEKGRAEGIVQGREQNLIENIRAVMDSFNVSVEKAMEVLKVPANQHQYFLEQLQLNK